MLKKTAIALAILGVSAAAVAQPTVEQLNRKVNRLSAKVAALENTVAKLDVPYTVYDQTGRAVGTTEDGQYVEFELDGVEGVTYRLQAGKDLYPDSPPNTVYVYESSDCSDLPYIQLGGNNRMEGVGYTQGVYKDADSNFVIPDPSFEPVEITVGSGDLGGGCMSIPSGPFSSAFVAPPAVLILDWVTPLTTIPPQ